MTSQRTPGIRSPFVGVAYKGLAAVLLAVAVSAASCGQQTTLPPPTSPSPPMSATPTPPVASAEVPHDRNDALEALREASVRQERFETLRRNLVLALPFDRAKTFPGFPLP